MPLSIDLIFDVRSENVVRTDEFLANLEPAEEVPSSHPGWASNISDMLEKQHYFFPDMEQTCFSGKMADMGRSGHASWSKKHAEREIQPAGGGSSYTCAELKAGCPQGVDSRAKELSLHAGEFEAALGVSKAAFMALPKWKRDAAKKRAGIF